MVNDFVSIITPAYNAAEFIEEAIRSVQQQTYSNWKMLIVDDCSQDETCLIVEAIAKTDERIILIKHASNRRAAGARETALDVANGRYIAFLDSDDSWLPDKLTHQLKFMKEVNAPLSFTSFKRISEDGNVLGRDITIPATLTYKQLLGNTAIATSTVIIDKAQTGALKITHTYYDDFALWLSILKRGLTAYGLNEDLMRYRVVNNSLSRNKGKSAMKVWNAYRNVENLNVLSSTWYFANYVKNALIKYRKL